MEEKSNKINDLKLVLQGKKKQLIIASAIIVVIIASTTAYIYSTTKTVNSWNDKIYPGVEVYGVSLGGLTKEEGLKVIEEQLMPKINEKKIIIKVDGKEKEIIYSDIAPNYDSNTILDEAMAFGKNESLFNKKSLISDKTKHELEPNITYDEELLKAKEAEIRQAVDIKPKNAQLTINGTTPHITPEEVGYTIDAEEFHKKIVESINGNPLENSELSFELKETDAEIKAEALSKVDGKISSFSTSFKKGSDSGRDKNMEVALRYINGTVLMPGDEFSYFNTIGDTTPEKGYELANVYVADRIEKDYGGGVCQVSTTLYRAAMGANLRSTERRNHSMIVSYSEPGLDATYATGYIDYKFKNTYDFPVYIQGYIQGNNVVINIFGNVAGMQGKTYKMTNEIIETYQPKVVKKDDPSLYVGQEKVKDYGMVGYKAKGYLITYENGVEVNKELISTDVYTAMDKVILVGTKPLPKSE